EPAGVCRQRSLWGGLAAADSATPQARPRIQFGPLPGGRGVGRIDYAPKGGKPTRSVYCLLAATPEGWRVVGHAASEAEVESHLSGQPPKPDRNE
ncbi:MAG TPA: hypothetical protein P5218_08280, partial [Planctomycetota bacterium]|nr:hypothetical protein [Planctomycetota bacterium]